MGGKDCLVVKVLVWDSGDLNSIPAYAMQSVILAQPFLCKMGKIGKCYLTEVVTINSLMYVRCSDTVTLGTMELQGYLDMNSIAHL